MATIVGTTGDDPRIVGTPETDTIFGDTTGTLTGLGGNDRIFGLANTLDEFEVLSGDALTIGPDGRGGDDVIYGGDGNDTIWGDASGTLFGIGGNDVIYQNEGTRGFAHGDARVLQAGSRGGDDKLFGEGYLIGDANDELISAVGGNDLLDATGASDRAYLYGDSYYQFVGTSRGGNDVLKGSAFRDLMRGDADNNLRDQSRGGNDRLQGNGGDDDMQGDCQFMLDTALGGNDVIRGGAGDDTVFGDARDLAGFARGGNDRIHGGSGDDELWGDGRFRDDAQGGRDRFFFSGNFGDDEIFDFREEDGDQLILQGLTQSEIQISIVTVDDPDDSTLITTLGDDSITLVGFTGGLTVGADILFT
jgi:Ca2+-binding RTX toxin-like protein